VFPDGLIAVFMPPFAPPGVLVIVPAPVPVVVPGEVVDVPVEAPGDAPALPPAVPPVPCAKAALDVMAKARPNVTAVGFTDIPPFSDGE